MQCSAVSGRRYFIHSARSQVSTRWLTLTCTHYTVKLHASDSTDWTQRKTRLKSCVGMTRFGSCARAVSDFDQRLFLFGSSPVLAAVLKCTWLRTCHCALMSTSINGRRVRSSFADGKLLFLVSKWHSSAWFASAYRLDHGPLILTALRTCCAACLVRFIVSLAAKSCDLKKVTK